MMSSRLDAMRAMVAKNPANAMAHFGLANEAAKSGLTNEALEHYEAYLRLHDDEGNAFGRKAELLAQLGRNDEAREALRAGILAAQRHGHPGMASELEGRLEELESE